MLKWIGEGCSSLRLKKRIITVQMMEICCQKFIDQSGILLPWIPKCRISDFVNTVLDLTLLTLHILGGWFIAVFHTQMHRKNTALMTKALFMYRRELCTSRVTLGISSTLRPFPACNLWQILIWFSCWLPKLLQIHLSCKFYSLSFPGGWHQLKLQHFLQMHKTWEVPGVSHHLELAESSPACE